MEATNHSRSMHTAKLLSTIQQDIEILFTSTSESILLIEANGTILVANQVSANWLNRDAESLTGDNLFQLLTPAGIPIREWVHEVTSKKTIYESDTRFGDRFIHVRLIPITTGGKVRRLIFIGQDITEQKRAEEQVREFTEQIDQKVRKRTAELEALNQKLTNDRQRAELLASLSQRLMQDTRDYSQLLEHITAEISKLIGDTCLIALFKSDLNVVEIQAITHRNVKSRLRQREQLLNQAVSVETTPMVSHILKGERFSAKKITHEKAAKLLPAEFSILLGENGLNELEVFPLHSGDQPLGILAIAREHEAEYAEAEISFVSSLASPIALAIQNARLFEQLSESQDQLRGLSQQLVQMQETQYRHLAKELHDRVGQDMTAININLNIMRTLLPQTISKDVLSRLSDTEKLVREIVVHMRTIMAEFRPPMLDQYGLAAALHWYSEQYSRRTNIEIKVNDQFLKDTRLPSELEIALFRIAQEALNNVAKHAQASQVDIELIESQENIIMTVTDNGVGFDAPAQSISSPGHWGVTNMQERARAVNGDFLLRSVPGQGTQVVVKVRKT